MAKNKDPETTTGTIARADHVHQPPPEEVPEAVNPMANTMTPDPGSVPTLAPQDPESEQDAP